MRFLCQLTPVAITAKAPGMAAGSQISSETEISRTWEEGGAQRQGKAVAEARHSWSVAAPGLLAGSQCPVGL